MRPKSKKEKEKQLTLDLIKIVHKNFRNVAGYLSSFMALFSYEYWYDNYTSDQDSVYFEKEEIVDYLGSINTDFQTIDTQLSSEHLITTSKNDSNEKNLSDVVRETNLLYFTFLSCLISLWSLNEHLKAYVLLIIVQSTLVNSNKIAH